VRKPFGTPISSTGCQQSSVTIGFLLNCDESKTISHFGLEDLIGDPRRSTPLPGANPLYVSFCKSE
jgi:hypothetical protein